MHRMVQPARRPRPAIALAKYTSRSMQAIRSARTVMVGSGLRTGG